MDVAADAMMIIIGLTHPKECWLALSLPVSHQPLEIVRMIPVIVFPKDHKFIAGPGGLLYAPAVPLCNVAVRAFGCIVHP